MLKAHAQKRAIRRYGMELDLPLISVMVRQGKARFVAPGKDRCAFYDVPYEIIGRPPFTVRALLSADRRFVITVVPLQHGKPARDRGAERRRAFFRGLKQDEDGDRVVSKLRP